MNGEQKTVELIAMTRAIGRGDEDPIAVAERAASVCYDSNPTASYRIAKACMSSGHMSVMEHVSFTFHITGVSRALLAQLSRHRHISLSVRSQRYCKEDGFSYIEPSDIRKETDLDYIFQNAMSAENDQYGRLLEKGVKPEDARMVLPNACVTEMYLTANARTLIEISRLRLCNRAQEEIRNLFWMIRAEVAKVSPDIADRMVPKCEQFGKYSFCTEREGCGMHPSLKELMEK